MFHDRVFGWFSDVCTFFCCSCTNGWFFRICIALTSLGFISFDDSSSFCFEFSPNLGPSSSGSLRKGGPSIQLFNSSGGVPFVRTSAGLLSDLMYRNACVSNVSCISATLTETNGLNFLEHVLIQVNTV